MFISIFILQLLYRIMQGHIFPVRQPHFFISGWFPSGLFSGVSGRNDARPSGKEDRAHENIEPFINIRNQKAKPHDHAVPA